MGQPKVIKDLNSLRSEIHYCSDVTKVTMADSGASYLNLSIKGITLVDNTAIKFLGIGNGDDIELLYINNEAYTLCDPISMKVITKYPCWVSGSMVLVTLDTVNRIAYLFGTGFTPYFHAKEKGYTRSITEFISDLAALPSKEEILKIKSVAN